MLGFIDSEFEAIRGPMKQLLSNYRYELASCKEDLQR
jgi:hypothetical protein